MPQHHQQEQKRLQAEVRQFSASPAVQRFLLIAFLLAIVAVPLFQTATELWNGQTPVALEVFTQQPSRNNLRAYERDLERSSWLMERVRPLVYSVWHRLFRYAGEKVIVG